MGHLVTTRFVAASRLSIMLCATAGSLPSARAYTKPQQMSMSATAPSITVSGTIMVVELAVPGEAEGRATILSVAA